MIFKIVKLVRTKLENFTNIFKGPIMNIFFMFQVDMPVFFYIDPDYVKDPFLQNANEITLSYTFFESKPGMKLPTYNPGSRK